MGEATLDRWVDFLNQEERPPAITNAQSIMFQIADFVFETNQVRIQESVEWWPQQWLFPVLHETTVAGELFLWMSL